MFTVVITPTTRQASAVRLVERIPRSARALRAGRDSKVTIVEVGHVRLLASQINRAVGDDVTNTLRAVFHCATGKLEPSAD